MNPIEDAIKVLRDLDMRSDLVEKLEALLKQEPIKLSSDVTVFIKEAIADSTQCEDQDMDYAFAASIEQLLQPLYATPRPSCDLKELCEDVVNECAEEAKAWSMAYVEVDCAPLGVGEVIRGEVDLDAIIAKHTGGK